MIRLALVATVALLAACSSTPQPLNGAAEAGGLIVVGTLATNPCEMRTAPVYTAAQVAVERATHAVRSGALPVAQAEAVLTLGRRAKADLDAACAHGVTDASLIAAAESAVVQMQTILGGVR